MFDAFANALPAGIFTYFMIFCRIGGAVMLMPGFGEVYVLPRYRLLLALALTVIITPVVGGAVPAAPSAPLALFILLAGEIAIGIFLGTIGRIIMGTLHTAGTVMSFQSGLANAMTFDPVSASQAAIPALFLSTVGILLIFVADIHHFMLEAVVGSYTMLVPGTLPPFDDFAWSITRLVGGAFTLGIQLAAPFIAVGLVFYLGIGLLARLMPQVQIFFVALPVQIFLGFLAFAFTISAILMWFLNRYRELTETALGG